MLQLQSSEKIITSVRKHWFVMLRTIIAFTVLILIPPLTLTFLPFFTASFNFVVVEPLVNFFLSLYIITLLLFLFLFWMDYYLDMWIVTDQRIIAIEQKGLFSREISEVPLPHVQDITIDISGIVETFLKFGTIRIQTAGEREFAIEDIPRLYEIKDIILKYSNVRTQQVDANQTQEISH